MSQIRDNRTPKAKAMQFRDAAILKVIVGKGEKTFWVHEGLICSRSCFFHNALSGNWTESVEKIVRLPDETVDDFELYLNMLYTDELPIASDETQHQFGSMITLYVLAEKLVDIKSKNLLIGTMIARSNEGFFPTAESIQSLYRGTSKGNKVRRLLADIFAEKSESNKFRKRNKAALPSEFWNDLAMALFAYRDRLQQGDQMRSSDIPENYMEEEKDTPVKTE